ncbi:6-carboxytetrahydropterin synthase [bacterium]|nr:6-carboxytetrahydropterin synthase [bacterium]
MKETFRVEVSKDVLVFSAGHFITFAGGICERVHGHNWRVKLVVEGPLDANQYVFDFLALRDDAKRIVDRLDHRMLLPTESQLIHVASIGKQAEVRFEDRFWSFPLEETILLPISNTTAELIAKWFAHELEREWTERGMALPPVLVVSIEENFGQWASYERRR